MDLGGVTIGLDASSGSLRSALAELFRDLVSEAPCLPCENPPCSVIGVGEGPSGSWIEDGGFVTPFSGFESLVSELIRRLNLISLASNANEVHLHAAGLTSGSHAVVVSAKSNTGKSTLCAALVLAGLNYLSDETIAVAADGSVHSRPKPLSLRPAGRALVDDYAAGRRTPMPDPGPSRFLPASTIGKIATTAQPALVVFLSRDDTSPSTTNAQHAVRMDPADAVVELIMESPDFVRMSGTGLMRLALLCGRSNCVRVNMGPLESSVQVIFDLLDHSPPSIALEPEAVAPRTLRFGTIPVRSTTDVVRLGDSLVLYSNQSHAVCSVRTDPESGGLPIADGGLVNTLREIGMLASTSEEG